MLSLMLAIMADASAFCGSYVGSAGAELYNNASEVVLVREDGRTTITMANDYEGDLSEFAMIVPVPAILSEEDVNVVDPGIFDTLRTYSDPRLVSYTCDELFPDPDPRSAAMDGDGAFGCTEEFTLQSKDGGSWDDTVVVEAQFIVGEYEIVILSAEESDGLLAWLSAEGYAVSSDASDLIQGYLDGGSYFFAAKVFADKIPAGQEMLSPLQFGYDSSVFSLPIKLGTVNSRGVQDLIIYGINSLEDGRIGISNYEEATVPAVCLAETDADSFGEFYRSTFEDAVAGDEAKWVAEYGWAVEEVAVKCDPCPEGIDTSQPIPNSALFTLGFGSEGAVDTYGYGYWGGYFYQPSYYFTRLHVRYTPAQATEDLSLYRSRITDNTQQRYILHADYLEDQFEICGEGWSEDPGSCADVDPKFGPRIRAQARADAGCAVEGAARPAGMVGLAAGVMLLAIRRRRA